MHNHHRPRKRFGQNFLQNQAIIENILEVIHIKANDHVIEIGPGLGALTRPLLQKLDKLTAIEIDRDLQARLSAMPEATNRLTVIGGDALSIDYSKFGEGLRLIGNLPYNISTPLLFHLLHFVSYIDDMHFMLQKEVVERLAAQPGNKTYGRISVMIQYYCEVTHLFDVPPEAFYPEPKVNSAIVRLTPHHPSPYPEINFSDLEKIVAQSFSMRRKTITNNLKPIMNAATIASLGIDPTLRPEQLELINYIQLAKYISN